MLMRIILVVLCVYATSAAKSDGLRARSLGSACASSDGLSTGQCTGCAPRKSNKCYAIFCDIKVNWFGANDFCNSIGMRLATVDNEEQQNEMLKVKQNSTCSDAKIHVWIGGHKLSGPKFVWMPTGQPVTYAGFLPGQPDNRGYTEEERCLDVPQGGWNDRECIIVQPVMCESVSSCA